MTLAKARIIKGTGAVTAVPIVEARRIPREVMDARAEAEAIIAGAAEKARAAADSAREDELAKLAALRLAIRNEDEKRAERDLERTIEIAKLLAERLIGEGLKIEPARIVELATAALHETRGGRNVRLEANPDDVPELAKHVGDLATVTANEELGRGSLLVHTNLGKIDARLNVQLERLAKVLKS